MYIMFSETFNLSFANVFNLDECKVLSFGKGLRYLEGKSQPFPKRQMLDSSKLKEFADDNSNSMKIAEISLKG